MRVLIAGGYGTFGGRLARLLADKDVTVIIAGRNQAAAEDFCRGLVGRARVIPAVFDRTNPEHALAELKPDLVVDASGPFQGYGDNPYRLVKAAIASGADYIDLADGADFVAGIGSLDAEAKAAGRFALSGMSSFPVLTAAVIRVLAKESRSLTSIRAGVAPSPYAGIGLNVVKAIASYAGKPVEFLSAGRWVKRPGFVNSQWMTVNVPGRVPLPPTRFALAEVPDLKILPGDWPELRTLWMGAGPRPALTHRLLWLAGWLVRLKIVSSLTPLAPLMAWAINRIRWGEHRGGMIIETADVEGRRNSWHLLAEGDSGPNIPVMAAQAMILRCLAGSRPEAGARSGHRDLEFSDYEPLFARCGIVNGFRRGGTGVVYADALGEAFGRLGPALRAFHGADTSEVWEGRAAVTRGKRRISRLAASVFHFPVSAADVQVRVTVERDANGETWTRDFGGRRLRSHHSKGEGAFEGLVVERFGPIRFGLAVIEQDGRLGLLVRRWSVLGVPLPRWLMPWTTAWEEDRGCRFYFDVEIGLPVVGQVVRYRGWLVRVPG